MTFDLVIRDGTIVDGSGAPRYRADVGINGNRISHIGRINDRGPSEINAEGHVVAPGFIDGHTHMDAQVMWDPLGTSSCWHGVTTAVMGHCGFSLAPARASDRGLVLRNLERAEDMAPEVLNAGLKWEWTTFPEYLDTLDRIPKGINYAANIGHSALRTWTIGERAFEEQATEHDMQVLEDALREALVAGALGFTTSRNQEHNTSDDRPVASRVAGWSEVARLVAVMGDLGAGIFQLAPGVIGRDDPADEERALEQLRTLAVSTRVPMTYGIPVPRPGMQRRLDLLDDISTGGGRAFGQSHCRGIEIILSFQTKMPFDSLPEWARIRALPIEHQIKLLSEDPTLRQRLVSAAHHGQYREGSGTEARKPDYTTMRVLERALPPNPTVAEVAKARVWTQSKP